MGLIQVMHNEMGNMVEFKTLKVGETFMHAEKIYMKLSVSCTKTQYGTAFSFRHNVISEFDNPCMVIPVNCKLVVED